MTVTAASVTVSTSSYVFAHGRNPRGTGTWAFFFDGQTDGDAFWVHCATYSDARRQAVAEAVRRGTSRVSVGS